MKENRVTDIFIPNIFLFRTLYYNRKLKQQSYYFHFMRDMFYSLDSMLDFLKIFQYNTLNKMSTIEISVINEDKIKLFSFDKQEIKSYKIINCICIFCRKILNNIEAIIIHFKLCHDHYDFYFTKTTDPETAERNTHIFCFLKKERIIHFERQEITKTFFFRFNKIAMLSQQKIIIFQNELSLIISKNKEIEKYNQEVNKESIMLHRKRSICEDKEFSINNSLSDYNNKKIRKPFLLVRPAEHKKLDLIKNVSKIINSKHKDDKLLKQPFLKKKNIILHKKTKLLKNIYFNSVTGQMFETNNIDLPSNEMLTFILEEDYFIERENKEIDEYYDICDKDKTFFKLWNCFMNSSDNQAYILLEKNLIKFIKENNKFLIENKLEENFLIHVINLFDYGIITKSIYRNVIKNLHETIENIKFKKNECDYS